MEGVVVGDAIAHLEAAAAKDVARASRSHVRNTKIRTSRHACFDSESGHLNERFLKETSRPSGGHFASSVVTVACPRDIRTGGSLCCKFLFSPSALPSCTKKTT